MQPLVIVYGRIPGRAVFADAIQLLALFMCDALVSGVSNQRISDSGV